MTVLGEQLAALGRMQAPPAVGPEALRMRAAVLRIVGEHPPQYISSGSSSSRSCQSTRTSVVVGAASVLSLAFHQG